MEIIVIKKVTRVERQPRQIVRFQVENVKCINSPGDDDEQDQWNGQFALTHRTEHQSQLNEQRQDGSFVTRARVIRSNGNNLMEFPQTIQV